MDGNSPTIRAAPLTNVAFVTRTSDDSPNGPVGKAATVPGFGEEVQDTTPCSLKGLSGGLAAGVLGYVFGFVPSMFRNPSLKSLHIWGGEGITSFKAFFVMSGIYTAVQCVSERIRQQDDGINRIIAGGASGVAVAWKSGLWGALQSGVMLAAVSWIFDFGNAPVAKAASLRARSGSCASGSGSGCAVSVGQLVSCSHGVEGPGSELRGSRPLHVTLGAGWLQQRQQGWGFPKRAEDVLKTPVLMWMGPIANQAYFSRPAISLSA